MKPKKVDGQVAARTDYYKYLIRRIIKGCFEIKCPIEFDYDYILNTLLFRGFLGMMDTSAGTLPVYPSVHGQNYALTPTEMSVELPYIGSFSGKIGVDCVLYKLDFSQVGWYWNFSSTVDVFAQRLASADAGIDVNIFNSKTAYVFEAENKAQADTLKAAIDDVSNGEPVVIWKANSVTNDGATLFFNNVKNNFIANDLQDTKRSIINELLTFLGVNNANTDKKERLITGEVDSNNEELEANIYTWKRNLEQANALMKKVFPNLDFSITYKYGNSSVNEPKEGEKDDISKRD